MPTDLHEILTRVYELRDGSEATTEYLNRHDIRSACVLTVYDDETADSDGTENQYNRKCVSKSRKLVACANVIDVIRLFAVDCADRVLPIFEKRRPNDKRVRRCLEVTRRYLKGDATIDELKDARAVAADAAAYAAYAAYASERKWQAEHLEELLKAAHPQLFIGGEYV